MNRTAAWEDVERRIPDVYLDMLSNMPCVFSSFLMADILFLGIFLLPKPLKTSGDTLEDAASRPPRLFGHFLACFFFLFLQCPEVFKSLKARFPAFLGVNLAFRQSTVFMFIKIKNRRSRCSHFQIFKL